MAGTSFLVEGGRANGPVLVAVGQDRANDRGQNLAHAPERAVGVLEVIFAADEVSVLHAPSIRMETTKCLVSKAPEKCCGFPA